MLDPFDLVILYSYKYQKYSMGRKEVDYIYLMDTRNIPSKQYRHFWYVLDFGPSTKHTKRIFEL